MNDYEAKARQFHEAFDIEVDAPLGLELLKLRKTLLAEEMRELFDEIDKASAELAAEGNVSHETMANLLKETADVQYVLSGLSVTFGFPIDEVYARVHASNMSKLGADGKPLRRADGKVLKGPDYHPPDLKDLSAIFCHNDAGKC